MNIYLMNMDSTKHFEKLDHDVMTENTWSHVRCEELIQDMEYGNLTVTFRVHKKRVTDILAQVFKRYRKSDNETPTEAKT